MQREITSPTPLLDTHGRVATSGWARHALFTYDRSRVHGWPLRLKEWNFYQLLHGDWVIQTTIGHVSYAGMISLSAFNLATGQRRGFARLTPLPLRRFGMDLDPEADSRVHRFGKDYDSEFTVDQGGRHVTVSASEPAGEISLQFSLPNDRAADKMVIATPFADPRQFYLNYKENYWSVSGTADLGDISLVFDDTTTALLDWGRGVWPVKHRWYWGSGTTWAAGEVDSQTPLRSAQNDGEEVDPPAGGRRVGFNIGWGFGDTSAATENMVFVDGRAHKLGQVSLERDQDYMAPWHLVDDAGMLDLTMTPTYDNYSLMKILAVRNSCHQVWGRWDGTITADQEVLRIENAVAFCEHAINRW